MAADDFNLEDPAWRMETAVTRKAVEETWTSKTLRGQTDCDMNGLLEELCALHPRLSHSSTHKGHSVYSHPQRSWDLCKLRIPR
jgi:hypothetical protein